ncbi:MULTISPECIES: PaaI family thioesterase [unclassified Acinetobacter]|uniref:PaaI family thioesterase n=1 Tax=unclassified Acinetobacter TaxID=196816 RepID=UPI002934F59F|nr:MULTISPECIES: PaaI family thioesterase [unclassified Acinetobacter]WOE32931.1 PaaI family thioesterase [Acinetobacter sp. SAAs470]WOE38408.1 PaaI family thioesterase [Acinetobacter sp. SAAs474]
MKTTIFSQLPPIHHLLGGHNIHWDADQREISIDYIALESFTNPRGTVEGGMICAMLDDAMGILAALNHIQKPAATINLSMDFFRACEVGTVQTKAWFIKEGKKILRIESEAWQSQTLIAKTSATFMILD